jgi:Transglycosylase SLT domain
VNLSPASVEGAVRRRKYVGIVVGACAPLLLTSPAAVASKAKPQLSAETIKEMVEKGPGNLQLVRFPDAGWGPVKIIRGGVTKQPGEKTEAAEIITFAGPQASTVRVLRGDGEHRGAAPAPLHPSKGITTQLVTFANFAGRSVSILRGSVPETTATELFGPALAADLDRVAFAVDGAESSHGLDLRMWRTQLAGPQGPMQVSEAAAIDVGGGDRFDIAENRALGRAYLARMYGRYGNWPDAIAAYNWGPGNVDAWIGRGRAASSLPIEVERYRDRVLRDAALSGAALPAW